ncbi:prephenate dehydratase, partial [Candidatus Roizmanbacteria bacterium CG10_big_fil_rev_8_21_14_0_10_39_6]
MAKIAYQGIAGAYSHIASVEQFGTQNTFMGVSDFSALFAEVTNRRVDFGVVPIENSLAGSVVENFDFLYKNEVYIIEERYMRIEHQLLGISIEGEENESRIAQLTHIFSHPKALEQCLTLFKEHPAVQKMPYEDTAGAAKYVKQMEKKEFGAIASKQAADLYGLSILKRNVEDNPNNWTRFVIIVPDKQDIFGKDEEGTYKCSAIFTLQNRP